MMAPIKFGVGQSVLRKEDDALIRGKGRYTDDHAPSAAMHALVLRSPHARAKFTIDAARARGLPGVALILTPDDVKDLGGLPCLFNLEVDPFTGPPYPILAQREVRHVGDAVAFVVAETVDLARDAIEAIAVEWTPLPAVIGVINAVKKGAPQVWPDQPGNVLFDVPIGDRQATEAAFAKAHAVAEISIVNPRVVTNFMEPRAAVGEYDAAGSPDPDHRQPRQPSAARHPVPEYPEHAGRKHAGDMPGCRRRLRHQAFPLSRICAGRGCRAQVAQDGEVDRRPRRPLHG
jgi:carbon-monoxide dehydrogenase large subunit